MKLLLDEQMPRKIARHFPENFIVHTVQSQGWEGVKNGELLALAASHGYDAVISADKNMAHQQNQQSLPLSVVVLHVYKLRIEELAPLIPTAISRLQEVSSPTFIRVDV